jgi:uncharacterized membrane protein
MEAVMFKSANVGTVDRISRLVIGVILIAAPFIYNTELWTNPIARWGIPIVGVVLVLTAFVRYCPIYKVIGANTSRAS